MSEIKPTQLSVIKPTQLSGIKPSQQSGIKPTQLSGMLASQVPQLTHSHLLESDQMETSQPGSTEFEYLSFFSVIHRTDTLENPASYLLGKVTLSCYQFVSS